MKDKSIIKKAASVKALEVNDSELTLINNYTLKPLAADEVYAFKLAMCDNVVDRHHEKFSDAALGKLAELFIGKTVISNHAWKSENQVARIYHTDVVDGDDGYKNLAAHCYMVKTDKSKDLIIEIDAGIKKEVSIGFRAGEVICSICGADNSKVICRHYGGREYDGVICFFTLNNPKDAYEVSFVAVPAQPRAGAVKDYGGEAQPEKAETETKSDTNEAELSLAAKVNDAFLFVETQNQNT